MKGGFLGRKQRCDGDLPSWVLLHHPEGCVAVTSLATSVCPTSIATEPLRVVVTESGPCGQAPRRIGRVKVVPNASPEQASSVIFDKPVEKLTAEDIRWMIDEAQVQYCYFGKHLLVDFSIIVPNYREDPQFQRY